MKTGNGGFKAAVNIFVDPPLKKQVLEDLLRVENIEEIYDVTGEFDIVSIVSASCLEEFRDVLQKKIMKIKGVKSTIGPMINCSRVGSHNTAIMAVKTRLSSATSRIAMPVRGTLT